MARSILPGLVLALSLATTGWAATPSPSLIVTPEQPKWSELTVQQKTILAPLSDDWDSLEYHRQKKWLGIAGRFPAMTPEEQRRIQIQMQEWGKLTDDERQEAREKYMSTKQLPIEKKRELKKKWEEYSSLPEEERARLRERALQFVNKSLGSKPGTPPNVPTDPEAVPEPPPPRFVPPPVPTPPDTPLMDTSPPLVAPDAPL